MILKEIFKMKSLQEYLIFQKVKINLFIKKYLVSFKVIFGENIFPILQL